MPAPTIGIGMDCSIVPYRETGLSLIQTTDFFYPIVDDPFMMGKIAIANVLSDLYAVGVVQVDSMLMLLGISTAMTEKERDAVIPRMIAGFQDSAIQAGVPITGGHTAENPWVLFGGVATSFCSSDEFILPEGAVVGDVLVLTKALGTQPACTIHMWLEKSKKENDARWNKVSGVYSENLATQNYKRAMYSMARLNKTGAELMHKYGAHGATDVTGFGLLGHAENLVKNQRNEVSFIIDVMPTFAGIAAVCKSASVMTNMLKGRSPETSGGLLFAISKEGADGFIKEILEIEGHPAWIVGSVIKGNRTAILATDVQILDVPSNVI